MTGRVVVGVDGSPGSEAALRWALEEARLRHADVLLVHAWQATAGAGEAMPGLAMGVLVGLAEEDARAVLAEALAEAEAGGVKAEGKLVCGGAGPTLLEAAAAADLVVVGARSHQGLAGALLGSVADHVARHAPCPVAVIPPTPR